MLPCCGKRISIVSAANDEVRENLSCQLYSSGPVFYATKAGYRYAIDKMIGFLQTEKEKFKVTTFNKVMNAVEYLRSKTRGMLSSCVFSKIWR